MRLRTSYANVVSTLALVLVVSGGAVAATQLPKHSVGNMQLKPSAVNSKKVKNGALKAVDFKPGQLALGLTGTPLGGDLAGTFPNPTLAADVLDGLVRDADLQAALATVPTDGEVDDAINQALADGVVLGDRATGSLSLNAGAGLQELVSLPGIVTVSGACVTAGPNRALGVQVTNAAAVGTWDLMYRQQSEGSDPSLMGSDELAPGASLDVAFPPDAGTQSAHYLELTVFSGAPLTIEVAGVTSTLSGGCAARASVLLDEGTG